MSCLFYLPIMSFYFCVRRDLPASSTVARIPNSLQPCCTFRLKPSVKPLFQLLPSFNPQLWPDLRRRHHLLLSTPPPPPTPPPSSSWSVSPGSGHISLVWTRRKLESRTLHFYCTQSLNGRGGTSDTPDGRQSGVSRRFPPSSDLLEDIIPLS